MMMKFSDRAVAQKWALTNGRDHCHAHQFWRVERLDNARDAEYAVAVRSRNDGALHHYAKEVHA